MKTAAEVCRDLIEYDKDEIYKPNKYEEILINARAAVSAAIDRGKLEPFFKPGKLVDTEMFFRGHRVLIETKMGVRQKASRIKKDFRRIMDNYMRTTHPALYYIVKDISDIQ